MSDFATRFGGLARLYGADGLARLRAAHVCVVGIGGVGTWAVEALARSGIGTLTLVDLDDICVTNINRQLHALTATVGQPKVTVMAERIRAINPQCTVRTEQQFFNTQTAPALLAPRFDFVLDAIDSVTHKVLLLAECRQRQLPVVASGGAGGRTEATSVRHADLAHASHDRLLGEVRKRLRRDHGFPPNGQLMGIDCIYSGTAPVFAQPDGTIGESCLTAADGTRLNCNGGLGSATFVTGTFGFAAAGLVVNRIARGKK